MRRLAFLALGLSAGCSEPPADVPPPDAVATSSEFIASGDWPSLHRDLAGTRHSPLGQINPSNVGDLRPAWAYALGADSTGEAAGGPELTPLVVAGVLYAVAADRVVALRADTGAELWRHALVGSASSQRGLAYWPGHGPVPSRVFVLTGRSLIALDAATGELAVDFGRGGEIEMPLGYHSAPTPFENLLIVGSSGVLGSVRALDARSGAQRWVFAAMPAAGGAEAVASDEAARDRPSLPQSPWSFTIDVDRALLYAVFPSPRPDDHYGGNRLGDNPFGNALVALDVRSGVRRWHFQTVHHDLWDYDLSAPPGLLDVVIDGKRVPALAQAAETGYLYLLDRVTGEPLFGIVETPMPESDVPGERSAPTQPIPVKPLPIARVSYVTEDLVTADDTTVAHASLCRELRDRSGGLQNLGPFTPYRHRAPGAEPRSTLVFPGSGGGADWGGTATDPALGLVFVNTSNVGSLGWIEANVADATAAQTGDGARRERLPYRQASAAQGSLGRFAVSAAPDGAGATEPWSAALSWPCQKPPWGQLVAIRAATAEIAWQVPLGSTAELPEERQRTGRPNSGGPITTAGGLVFIGASDDRRFRAFDSRTGTELWATRLPLAAHAVPVTYLGNDGKQYVAVAAAGGAGDGAPPQEGAVLIAYALP